MRSYEHLCRPRARYPWLYRRKTSKRALLTGVVFKRTPPWSQLSDPAVGLLKRLWLSKATG